MVENLLMSTFFMAWPVFFFKLVFLWLLKFMVVHHYTTGDGFFAECPKLCRVLSIGHSAKRLFTDCQRESTRQTTGTRQWGGLPSAEHSANNNTRQRGGLPSVRMARHSVNQNTQQVVLTRVGGDAQLVPGAAFDDARCTTPSRQSQP